MKTTIKKEMERYYGVNAEDVIPVRLNTDETVYIHKHANTSGERLVKMYQKNGNAVVEKRFKCKEYTPAMLHPANICAHPRENWKKFRYSWGDTVEYCPECTPMIEEAQDPLNCETNPC